MVSSYQMCASKTRARSSTFIHRKQWFGVCCEKGRKVAATPVSESLERSGLDAAQSPVLLVLLQHCDLSLLSPRF